MDRLGNQDLDHAQLTAWRKDNAMQPYPPEDLPLQFHRGATRVTPPYTPPLPVPLPYFFLPDQTRAKKKRGKAGP